MIEIEKKFLINQPTLKKITRKAELISQQKLVDIYYDTVDFKLTTKDWWLRNRNGKFELKVSVIGSKSSIDQYQEIDKEKEIYQYLKINLEKSLLEALKQNNISPFATIVSERKKYKKDDFTIDFDITDFGYSICEVELMVEDESKIDQALIKIDNFRKENSFRDDRVRGKLIEYIYRNNLQHYQTLQAAGVIKD
ncbi:MAG: Thiamine-triphosphatase [Berkelbacteria bacterium GW2011_GWA1_36_9]|uniref:Thiamine-triphosphatase n=1 Tax=Berkelbacteria bacterium GW2011_GWA1_36_9 TaxID=1618331 RepID=A0A0G0FKM8_9BACT|nr:MAG: Thiamine-triphosphatase [Berkelbacteria bacterium GW2011_GWA1_36_9]